MKPKAHKRKGKTRPGRKPASSTGLRNPVVATAATVTAMRVAEKVLPWVILGGLAYWAYRSWKNRFIPLKERSDYPDANISKSEAESRADAIEQLKPMFGEPDFDSIRDLMAGLNYNGFVRLYNAFGLRDGSLLDTDLTLPQWLQDQMSAQHYKMLGALQNHIFF